MNILKSGVFDINNVEIKDGDYVLLEIKILNRELPLSFVNKVGYLRGAFRFVKDTDSNTQSCIGDISYNCTLKVLSHDEALRLAS